LMDNAQSRRVVRINHRSASIHAMYVMDERRFADVFAVTRARVAAVPRHRRLAVPSVIGACWASLLNKRSAKTRHAPLALLAVSALPTASCTLRCRLQMTPRFFGRIVFRLGTLGSLERFHPDDRHNRPQNHVERQIPQMLNDRLKHSSLFCAKIDPIVSSRFR